MIVDCKVQTASRYHWDTSDWAPGPSMPNISEIPTNEILDSPSSSQPSDDCNANARADPFDDNITTRGIYNMSLGDDHSPLLSSDEQNPNRLRGNGINFNDDDDDEDDEEENVISRLEMDDYFDDSEYVGDSEYAENEPYDHDDLPPSYAEHPRYEQFLQNLDDSYEMPEELINRQPLHYLPDHFSTSHQELAIDPLTEDEDEREFRERMAASVLPPPPPHAHLDGLANMMMPDPGCGYDDEDDENFLRLRPPKEFMTPGYMTDSFTTDKDQPSNRTSFVDDLSLSMGGFTSNASLSDISGLCEIDDSEINASDTDDENTPCLGPGFDQTQL
ncbi:fat cadherin [Plakobranchus ocellatus]|uniref:Fat cadherin n=1 Tax=Plakobranchus ocellatus TaxID=259542 RepID=A0AAV3XY11_9GAST|nr:fat cadherin [Plakobranchus ocellatus]